MIRMITLVINKAIDEVIKWKTRNVSFKNHWQRPSVVPREFVSKSILCQKPARKQAKGSNCAELRGHTPLINFQTAPLRLRVLTSALRTIHVRGGDRRCVP